MGKKISAAIFALSVLCLFAVNAAAQEEPEAAARRAALTERAKQTLTSREWIVYVTVKPETARAPAVTETDSLVFTGRTVTSRNLSAKGYSKNGSNYSLWVSDDGSIVWETMQFDEQTQDIAFLRGELKGTVMTGAVIYKPVRGKGATYHYSTLAN